MIGRGCKPLRRTPLQPGSKRLARRTPLKASSTLERGEPLVRRARLKPLNAERRVALVAKQFGPEASLVRSLPCAACGRKAPSQPHHVKTRGAGGKKDAQVPLCASVPRLGREGCHDEIHRIGRRTFELRHGIDLARVAAVIHQSPAIAAVVCGSPAQVVEQWRRLAAAEVPS